MLFTPFAFMAAGVAYDPDAQAFFDAVEGGGDTLTDTQKDAVNTLVVTMKADGIYTKMLAVYPFVGGTASAHKWNLIDPQNTDAAYRLTFNGGFTHDSEGVTPNGSNTYANTHLNPTTDQTLGDRHFSFYSLTTNTLTGYEFGAGNGLQNVLITRYGGGNMYSGFSSYTQGANSNSNGFYIAGIGSPSGTQVISKNGDATLYTNTGRSDSVAPNTDVFMFADNRSTGGSNPVEYSSKKGAFASFGESLDSTERSDFYDAVQAYQTTLGRQV